MKGKKVALFVSGGIAVYKAVALTSKLVQAGAQVKVLMTASATQFVTPLSFQALARTEVYTDTFDEKRPEVISHIDVADWADVCVVAPATANCIAKIANGLADDMVTTTLLATEAPIVVAPAMNVHMYNKPAVQRNLQQLRQDGILLLEPTEGFLACGYVGKGRMEEPEKIIAFLQQFFQTDTKILTGQRVVITAGPTIEKIDPVRYVTNFSSGKMGYAMAAAAQQLGAEVVLISGPVALTPPAGIVTIQVQSAAEMLEAVLAHFDEATVVIKSAAVADYRPASIGQEKIKKMPGDASIQMERTVDILQLLGQRKQHQLLIGFAAETEKVMEHAQEKIQRKNANYLIVNDVTNPAGGFGSDTNVVTLLEANGHSTNFPAMDKFQLALALLQTIAEKEGFINENR